MLEFGNTNKLVAVMYVPTNDGRLKTSFTYKLLLHHTGLAGPRSRVSSMTAILYPLCNDDVWTCSSTLSRCLFPQWKESNMFLSLLSRLCFFGSIPINDVCLSKHIENVAYL